MGGNVAEWVSDRGKRPTPRAEPLAVLRGGSFVDEAPRVVVTTRLDVPRVTAHVSIGFRCAKSAD